MLCTRCRRPSMSCCRNGPGSSPQCRSWASSATSRPNSSTTTKDDLVRNLTNLEPTLKALADVGPDLGTVLAYIPAFPFSQNFIDRAIRGDYINIFATIDLTYARLKRSLSTRHPVG